MLLAVCGTVHCQTGEAQLLKMCVTENTLKLHQTHPYLGFSIFFSAIHVPVVP